MTFVNENIYDCTKLRLRRDEVGNAVWSFLSVKPNVPCEMVEVRRLSTYDRDQEKEYYSSAYHISLRTFEELVMDAHYLPSQWKEELIDRAYCVRGTEPLQRHGYVKWLAYKGELDGFFPEEEIEDASVGVVPKDCNVHHKQPISFYGSSRALNLHLMKKTLHARVHCVTTDALIDIVPIVKKDKYIPDGKKNYVMFPKLPRVLTEKNIADYFYGFEDLIQEIEKDCAFKNTGEQVDQAVKKGKKIPHKFIAVPLKPIKKEELKPHSEPEKQTEKGHLSQRLAQMRAEGKMPPDPTKGSKTQVLRFKKTGKGRWERREHD